MANPVEIPASLRETLDPGSFRLFRPQLSNPSRGGDSQVIEIGAPLWVAEYKTKGLTRAQRRAWQGFVDSLEGGRFTFLGHDPTRRRPLLMPTGSLGSPIVTQSNPTARTIGMSAWAPNAALSIGDLISYFDGAAWRLHSVTADVAASGGAITASVQPPPRAFSGQSYAVRAERAACEMRLVPNSFRMSDDVTAASATFAAHQVIEQA